MPKKVEPSEKKVLVSIKMGLLHDLMQISQDINTAIEYLFNEIQRKEEALTERDTIIEKLINGIEVIQQNFKEIEKEENRVSIANQLKDLQVVLQNHLDYLNRNAKVKQ
jgi:prefoldin subunit 5